MNRDIRILMIGPLARTGGVANHTANLTKILIDSGLQVLLYNINFEGDLPGPIVNFIKLYKRTLGQFYFSFRMRRSYDIVHVQASGGIAGFLNAITAAAAILILRNKKMILTFHHGDAEKFIKKYRYLINAIANISDYLIVVSENQKKIFLDEGVIYKKIKLIPNGYSSKIFLPKDMNISRMKLRLPADLKILVNVANLNNYKGHEYVIKAMKKIMPIRDDIVLYIIGEGPLRGSLNSLINEYELQNNVILTGGNKPPKEVSLWLNASNLFILPSVIESFGIVQIEAMACGKPVVATKNGGSEDIIINDMLGILVETKDPEGLMQAILHALDVKWNEEYILAHAERYTWENVSKEIIGVYEQVLG